MSLSPSLTCTSSAVIGAGLLGLGALFVAAPRRGTALFGLPRGKAQGWAGAELPYVRALGIRDIALGLGLAAAGLAGRRRSVGALAATAAIIPVGDLMLVRAARGRGAAGPKALHALSGAVPAGLAVAALAGR